MQKFGSRDLELQFLQQQVAKIPFWLFYRILQP